jgi:hypothetical protein
MHTVDLILWLAMAGLLVTTTAAAVAVRRDLKL